LDRAKKLEIAQTGIIKMYILAHLREAAAAACGAIL
jgi:hypothetical protein